MHDSTSKETSWLRTIVEKRDPKLRLICFPHAGGNALQFQYWADRMPTEVELVAVTYPGHWGHPGKSLHTRMEELLGALTPEIVPALNCPYAFFGHSMGALIAFELARKLRWRSQRLPQKLLVSACRAPHIPHPWRPIHTLCDTDFVSELERIGGAAPELGYDKELLAISLPVLRADFEIIETWVYRHEAALATPITAFVGFEDRWISLEGVEPWRQHTMSEFRIQTVPGDHFYRGSESTFIDQVSIECLQCFADITPPNGLCSSNPVQVTSQTRNSTIERVRVRG